ncbi:MAG: hypothetical protein AB1801_18385 [Chloroflexota bacterium]
MSTIHPIAQSTSPGRVTADFFTDSHRFSASVVVYKRRLIDVLGDKMTDYLDLIDIYVSRNNNPGEIVGTYQRGSLIKDEINFIVLSSETQAISKQKFYTPNRVSLPIFITVPFFEIRGKFQWMGDLDVKKILTTETQHFLPILDASAANPFFPQFNFQGPTALVNKSRVELLCITRDDQ